MFSTKEELIEFLSQHHIQIENVDIRTDFVELTTFGSSQTQRMPSWMRMQIEVIVDYPLTPTAKYTPQQIIAKFTKP